MPIRMEKDSGQESPRRPRRRGAGGGNMLGKLLPLILIFVSKRPKLLVPLLLIGAAWYFLIGGKEMFNSSAAFEDSSNFSLGAALSEEVYDRAEVFEPLAYGSQNVLPRSASLKRYAPKPLHQGRQGSCVGWASAYAAGTIQQARSSGRNPNDLAFSPAYLYNQIALEGCQGAYMADAMKAMLETGALPLREFRYDDRTCANYPNALARNKGQQYRIIGFNRLTLGAENYSPDIIAIKQNLAQGAPVVIGMQVGGSFMSRMLGQDVWRPTSKDYSMRGFSGHAMCVVGYDDDKEGGAFPIPKNILPIAGLPAPGFSPKTIPW